MKIQGMNTNQNMLAMQGVQRNQHENVAKQNNVSASAAKNATKVAAKSDANKVPAKVQVEKGASKVNQNKPSNAQAAKTLSENTQRTQNLKSQKMQTYNAGGHMQMMQAASELVKGQRVDLRA